MSTDHLLDWNGDLHVVNGSPLSKPYPKDRPFWIVTEEAEAREVAYSHDHKLYTGRETYCLIDGEPGSWEPDEIAGWTDSREDAERAAEMLAELMGWQPKTTTPTTCIETIGGAPETALRLSFQIKVF